MHVGPKSLKFVILCTNPMQIGNLDVIHEYNWLCLLLMIEFIYFS